jgi:hypothetical protein
MSRDAGWLLDLGDATSSPAVDGLVAVNEYQPDKLQPEQVAVMERAEKYGATAVFFEAGRNGRAPIAQALVFVSDGPANDPEFAELHQRLWSWGGVPLVYRKTPGLIQLFRCAHKPDFIDAEGKITCQPFKTLSTVGGIASDPWWHDSRLRNGTLWDDPKVCKQMLKADKAAHKSLIDAVKKLNADLNQKGILPKHLRRKLLILSLLIAYLEERGVFSPDYFGQFLDGATKFFQVLANGEALIALLSVLEDRFNGHVFVLDDADRESLRANGQLSRFARLVEARREENGQLTLWELYSFKDLPIELISHIYQMFVEDNDSSVYTPPFLVRLMLGEVLSPERLDRLQGQEEIILDPCCGSGVFLVEAYKRLVLHWRSRNGWKQPSEAVLKGLLQKVHGIDTELGAVEVAAFSLCLALCDSLEPETIRASVKLFPELAGKTLIHSCFFEAREKSLVKEPVGVVVGNPPFKSSLTTEGANRSYIQYEADHGSLPDKQLAYLFLHEAAEMLADGGALSMLQQYNFLYNQQSVEFRRHFISKWDVRELLDFISVRGLFQKGHADTKVIVVVAEAVKPPNKPPKNRKILHATFRRSGRVDAEQGFDIDYYDLHWLPRHLALSNDAVWRTNLLGGGRALAFVDRLKQFRTLGKYAEAQKWDYGEGFIEARKGKRVAAEHLTGKPLIPSVALTEKGLDRQRITTVKGTLFKTAYTSSRFTQPMLLVREHEDIPHYLWLESYLTYSQQIVGFCGPEADTAKLREVSDWLSKARRALKAYVALASPRLFAQKATALQADDIFSIPYPEEGTLDLSPNECILVDDIVDYYRDLIRLGEGSPAMRETGHSALPDFSSVFTRQISAIYKKKPLRSLTPQTWPGVICQPFAFGKGQVDWSGADALSDKLGAILRERQGQSLRVTRIARIYDGSFIFLLKPDRLRYRLRSVALRDADETLADLRAQGF